MIPLKNIQLNKREQLLIIIFLTAALYLIGWHVTGKNSLDNLDSIRSETSSLKNEQALLLNLLEESAVLEEAFLKENNQHEQLINKLPDLETLPRVLSELEVILAEKPVALNSLRIGDTEYYDHYAAVTMKLRVTAAPHHLFSLLEGLESLPHVIYFDYLTWTKQSNSDIEMELLVHLLFYHPQTEEIITGGIR